jgi:putative peptidoglycan lipid II flippase
LRTRSVLANETPNLIYELLLGGVLSAALVPIFVEHRDSDDDEATAAVFTVALVALIALVVIAVVAAPLIARVLTLKSTGPDVANQRETMTGLIRFFMPQIVFYGFTALATSLLNAHRRYAAAALAPVLNNIVVICTLVAIPRLYSGPITIDRLVHDPALLALLGIGTTAGVVAMSLVLVPSVLALHLRLRPMFAWAHPAVRKVMRLSGWTIAYIASNQVSVWIVLVLAWGVSGGVFAYTTGYAFFQMPHGLFAVSIMTTLAPEMASAAQRGDWARLRRHLGLGLRTISLVVIPSAAALMVLARPVIRVFLQHGSFDPASAPRIADAAAAFAVGLLAFSAYLFTLRAFYSMQDTRTPFWINVIENVFNVVLALALYPHFGIRGLALSFSLAYIGGSAVVFLALHRRLGGLHLGDTFEQIGRMIVAGVLAGVAGWFVVHAIDIQTLPRALAAFLAGGIAILIVYALALTALRVHELKRTIALVMRRPSARDVTP